MNMNGWRIRFRAVWALATLFWTVGLTCLDQRW